MTDPGKTKTSTMTENNAATAGNSSQKSPTPKEKADALFFQQVVNAYNLLPLIDQSEKILATTSESDGGDSAGSEPEPEPVPSTSAGISATTSTATGPKKKKKKKHQKRGEDRLVNGVITTREDRRNSKKRLFNFTSVDPERQWLRDVLMTSTESSSEDETDVGINRRIKQIFTERRLYLKYKKKFDKDNPKHQHMHYSSGFMSTMDRYPEDCASRSVSPRPSSSRGSAQAGDSTRSATVDRRGNELAPPTVPPITLPLPTLSPITLLPPTLSPLTLSPPTPHTALSPATPPPLTSSPPSPPSPPSPRMTSPPPTLSSVTLSPPTLLLPTQHTVIEPLFLTMSDALTMDWDEHLQSMTLPLLMDNNENYNFMECDMVPDSGPGPYTSCSGLETREGGTVFGGYPRKVEPVPAKSSMEVKTAQRHLHWNINVTKDLVKVHSARRAASKEGIVQKKRLAEICAKQWRTSVMQSQRNTKEIPERCKRLSREMLSYWRRYGRTERDVRNCTEEAKAQRKMDEELLEAKRQRRQLNFLITQTELYVHFMRRMALAEDAEDRTEEILHQLDEEEDPRLAAIEPYDSNAMKIKAAQNARDAYRAERIRIQYYDEHTGVTPETEVKGGFDQPTIFKGELTGYQLKGMNWVANFYDQGISGILADEKGLGKRVQCIASLCHVAERLGVWGPFIVVSHASTLYKWHQELKRFAPDFKVVPYWGSPSERMNQRQFLKCKDLNTRGAAFHVVVTSYQIAVSDLAELNCVLWQYMIMDEAQAIKSTQSMRWKQLIRFRCRNRLLLSEIPTQNSMAELWGLLFFIVPKLFHANVEFNEWFSKYIECHAVNKSTMDEKYLSRLNMILKPFMLRRIKKDVENEPLDKIETMIHCPLSIRQKLLCNVLKQEIKIEELLHSSIGAETGHSNLKNLVMQFRQVCNHPELFKRRDVRSPFAMHVDDYHIPKLIAEDGILIRSNSSKQHLLYNKFSVLTPDYINQSLKEEEVGVEKVKQGEVYSNGLFAFTRLTNLSPMEIYKVMLCGLLYAIHHIEATTEKYELVRHRNNWWYKMCEIKGKRRWPIATKYYDRVRIKDMILICPDGDTLNQKKGDGIIWKDLLFTDPLWVQGGPFFAHTDHILHYMPETMEHRAMRHRHHMENNEEWSEVMDAGDIASVSPKSPAEFHHVEREPTVLRTMATPMLDFLFTAQPKVVLAPTRTPFAVSCAFAYHVTRHQHAECAEGADTLARLVARSKPHVGWAFLQVPDKNQLVSDSGKLTVLDSLLKKLKESGHRVLIYSQMNKMIDLLEEYLCYRKYNYMRLDCSSEIAARRDMVSDFQTRPDIMVFLLSTPVGELEINMTAADTVIFYDSDWDSTVDQQEMDCGYPLGQTKQVTVYRLLSKGTVEERIVQRSREKNVTQRMLISGGQFKPVSLEPSEIVPLLLDDEEDELTSVGSSPSCRIRNHGKVCPESMAADIETSIVEAVGSSPSCRFRNLGKLCPESIAADIETSIVEGLALLESSAPLEMMEMGNDEADPVRQWPGQPRTCFTSPVAGPSTRRP